MFRWFKSLALVLKIMTTKPGQTLWRNISTSTVYGSIQPGTDCPTSCGNVSIPFPFGTKLGCFAAVHLYLACMPGTILPVLELTSRMVVSDISLDDGVLHIREESEPDDFFSGSGRIQHSTLCPGNGE